VTPLRVAVLHIPRCSPSKPQLYNILHVPLDIDGLRSYPTPYAKTFSMHCVFSKQTPAPKPFLSDPYRPQHGSGQHCDCHFRRNLSSHKHLPYDSTKPARRVIEDVGEENTTRYLCPLCNQPPPHARPQSSFNARRLSLATYHTTTNRCLRYRYDLLFSSGVECELLHVRV
jgi:hypothetical protein